MTELVDDTLAWPTLVKLAGCLENEFTAAGLDDLCFLGIVPGGQVAIDVNCAGQAWVRLVNVYPSVDFPVPDPRASCNSLLAYRVEIGSAFPIPTMDTRGNPPTVDQQLVASRKQMAAMRAMKRAIACCLTGDTPYILETYTPLENLGGAGGGTWTFVVGQEF